MHKIFELFLKDLETHKNDEKNKTNVEKYHVNCWRTSKAIDTSIEKLKIAEEYVLLSSKFIPAGKGGDIGKYIEFNIENYMIRSRAVYDRVLIFTNNLCNIGMSEEYINHNAIITNQKVIDLELKPKLKSINKACSTYRESRNTIIHHDKYENEHLDWVTVANQAASWIGDNYETILGISKEEIISNTLSVIVKHKKDFEQNTNDVISKVDIFLDAALEIYYKYHNQKIT